MAARHAIAAPHASRRRRLANTTLAVCAAVMMIGSVWAQVPHTTRDYLRQFDSDGDGRVSLAEFQDYMSRGFVQMDRNGDGILTADELPAGTRARKAPTLEARLRELSAAFDRQDLDNDGYLDAREMAAPPQ